VAVACGPISAEIPDAGVAAENRGDLETAARIYRDTLQQHPDDIAVWQRLSDVEAARHDANAAADALEHAARIRPGDANLQTAASRALATANRPAEALAAIQRALVIEPDNVEHLIAQAQLANWAGNTALAESSLQQVIDQVGERPDLEDDIARSRAWQGDLSGASEHMDRYLASYPDDRAAALDAVRFLAWRGDYPAAIQRLDDVEKRLNANDESRALRARLLAWAGFPRAALAVNTPLLEQTPGDYERAYTQALALRQSRIPRQAQPYIDQVAALKPDAKETRDLVNSSRAPLGSHVDLSQDFASDSLNIDRRDAKLWLDWALGSRIWLLADAGRQRLGAPLDSPFASINGRRWLHTRYSDLGLRFALNDRASIEGSWGNSTIAGLDSLSRYRFALDLNPGDHFNMELGADRDRFDISPRSLSLGLDRKGYWAQARWRPNLRWTVDAFLRRDDISDGNVANGFDLAARRVMHRGGSFDFDLGGAAAWQRFDFDPGNGYYAPGNYRRFQLTGFGYWHLGENAGLNLTLASGLQRDETLNGWKPANDITAELVLGIFSKWQLRLQAAYSDRRQNSGAFNARRFGVVVERRW